MARQLLTFKNSPLRLEVIRETKNYYITNKFISFGIGRQNRKTARWDKETRKCLDAIEGHKYNNILSVSPIEIQDMPHVF